MSLQPPSGDKPIIIKSQTGSKPVPKKHEKVPKKKSLENVPKKKTVENVKKEKSTEMITKSQIKIKPKKGGFGQKKKPNLNPTRDSSFYSREITKKKSYADQLIGFKSSDFNPSGYKQVEFPTEFLKLDAKKKKKPNSSKQNVVKLFSNNMKSYFPDRKTEELNRAKDTHSFINNKKKLTSYYQDMSESTGKEPVLSKDTKKILQKYGVEVPKKGTNKVFKRLMGGARSFLKNLKDNDTINPLFTKDNKPRAIGFVECNISYGGKKKVFFQAKKFMNSGKLNHKTGFPQRPTNTRIPSFKCFSGYDTEPYSRITDVEYLILNEIEEQIKIKMGSSTDYLSVSGQINILVSLKPCNSCCSALCIMKSLYPKLTIRIFYANELKNILVSTRDKLKKQQ